MSMYTLPVHRGDNEATASLSPQGHSPLGIVRRSRGGFTLIELLVVMAIIAILIGLILPVGQHGREQANLGHAQAGALQIVQAELKSGQVTTDLTVLAKQGLIDRTLASGAKDGYRFAVVVSPAGGFYVAAVPAAPGITGATDLMVNQNGVVVSSPSRGAEKARAEMLAAIDKEAVETLGNVLAQLSPKQQAEAQRALKEGYLQEPATTEEVFKRLDADGNGIVTLEEIAAYDSDNAKSDLSLSGFAGSVSRIMQLGAANEDVHALPGVRLRDLQSGCK